MRVRFADQQVFDCQEPLTYQALRKLFLRAACGQHEIDVDDPQQVLASDFYSRMTASSDQQEWEELLRRTSPNPFAVPPEGQRYALVCQPEPPPDTKAAYCLPISKVGAWAEQPLRVWLENQRDEVLIKLAAKVSGSSCLQKALDQGWLEPLGCGGCGEVLNAIGRAEAWQRRFALVDSDKTAEHEELSSTVLHIHTDAKAKSIPVYLLTRRELENYIPEQTWQAVVPTPSKKPSRSHSKKQQAQKVGHVLGWVLKQVDQRQSSLTKMYGDKAVQEAKDELTRLSDKLVSLPSHHQSPFNQLIAWQKMSPTLRHTDDLKARFGEKHTKAAVSHMSDPTFNPANLDAAAQAELRVLAQEIEGWL